MANEFTYKITKEGNKEYVKLECPSCQRSQYQQIDKGQKRGKRTCDSCSCEFEWERE